MMSRPVPVPGRASLFLEGGFVSDVAGWKWVLGLAFLAGSAFFSSTGTALTALGEARARQLREAGGRRSRFLAVWIEQPERVLSTLLIGNTLAAVGVGALAASVAGDLVAGHPDWTTGTAVVIATALTTAVVLFFGEIVPRTLARRRPVHLALASIAAVSLLTWLLWPVTAATSRGTTLLMRLLGRTNSAASPPVTSEEIEFLIERGTREGVLDEVKEELLNSVLEFADRVVKEIMVPRTRMVAIDRHASPEELTRVVTENPYSRMPVFEGTIDNVVGILMVREIVLELRRGPIQAVGLDGHLRPAFFVPEQMKISRLLKEMAEPVMVSLRGEVVLDEDAYIPIPQSVMAPPTMATETSDSAAAATATPTFKWCRSTASLSETLMANAPPFVEIPSAANSTTA